MRPPFTNQEDRLASLTGQITEVRRFEVECSYCCDGSTAYYDNDLAAPGGESQVSARTVAEELLRCGWRYCVRHHLEGWMCPDCADSATVLDEPVLQGLRAVKKQVSDLVVTGPAHMVTLEDYEIVENETPADPAEEH